MIRCRSQPANLAHQQGSSIVEMTVAMGVFLFLGLGAWQWGLLYEAKSTARHAAFMAARAAANEHAKVSVIRNTFARYLSPMFAPDSGSDTDIAKIVANVTLAEANEQHLQIKILNPVKEAFTDFGKDLDQDGRAEEIPNIDVNFMDKNVGSSQLNIQDANLLKVQLIYGFPLKVPLMGSLFAKVTAATTERSQFEANLLENNRLPILITSTVRMQSYAKLNNAMVSRNQAAGNYDKQSADKPNQSGSDTEIPIFISSSGGGGKSHANGDSDGAAGESSDCLELSALSSPQKP